MNHAGKAYRAPGSFSTAEDAARAYDKLVRTLGLTGSKRVNFPQNDGERAYVRSDKKRAGKRTSAKKVEASIRAAVVGRWHIGKLIGCKHNI